MFYYKVTFHTGADSTYGFTEDTWYLLMRSFQNLENLHLMQSVSHESNKSLLPRDVFWEIDNKCPIDYLIILISSLIVRPLWTITILR